MAPSEVQRTNGRGALAKRQTCILYTVSIESITNLRPVISHVQVQHIVCFPLAGHERGHVNGLCYER